jgi:hypothetical protein
VKPWGKLLTGLGKLLAGLGKLVLGWLLFVLGKLLASGKWLIFIAALGALVAGSWLLVKVWQGQPVAAAFTRVAGATHVETALEASRFWTTPPRRVVTVSANAKQGTMLGAAQCAVAYNAPLLFRSRNRMQERMVEARIKSWGLNPKGPDVASIEGAKQCLGHNKSPADVGGLSAYNLRGLPLPHPYVAPVQGGLAPVAVFAAAWARRFPPDIAVGLALAAHMAKAYGEVSLVVVPRYEEASSKLDAQLRGQRGLVKGGVILGDTKILSEDTRALLRQLLTSTNEQAVLSEIRTNLGLIAPLLAALAGLFALGMEPKVGESIASFGQKSKVAGQEQQKTGRSIVVASWRNITDRGGGEKTPQSDWLTVLAGNQNVTVWLHDGAKFTGTVDYEHHSVTVLRLQNVDLTELDPGLQPPAGGPASDQADVLVAFAEIRLISVRATPPTAPGAGQSTTSVGSGPRRI